MRISDLTTEQLAPVLCDLAVPVSDIATDPETVNSLKKVAEGKNNITQLGAFVREIIPLLLATHFESTCQIIAILTGKKPEEIKKQKGLQTISDAVSVFDEDFLDFFKSFVHTEPKE